MAEIIVIPPTKNLEQENKKIRTAAYARVSSDLEDQKNSFLVQMDYYKQYIKRNPKMEFVDMYADEGITGTSKEKRTDFLRMIADCKRNINQKTMALLFLQLINHTDKLESYEQDETIVKVLRYIEDNYKDGSLSKLAEILYCDTCYLSREIKRKTGKNYVELLREKRLSQACFYLRNTKMSIEDIIYSVGYQNVSYFYRVFEEKYGLSPRKYRNN